MTEIRDNLQQVSKKYESPERFMEIMENLSDDDNRKLLVSNIEMSYAIIYMKMFAIFSSWVSMKALFPLCFKWYAKDKQ